MICYAIKNEEGRYFRVDSEALYWTPINYATLFEDFGLARCCCPSRCKVVKVEIREVEDE